MNGISQGQKDKSEHHAIDTGTSTRSRRPLKYGVSSSQAITDCREVSTSRASLGKTVSQCAPP
jgi:hypothetical protein